MRGRSCLQWRTFLLSECTKQMPAGARLCKALGVFSAQAPHVPSSRTRSKFNNNVIRETRRKNPEVLHGRTACVTCVDGGAPWVLMYTAMKRRAGVGVSFRVHKLCPRSWTSPGPQIRDARSVRGLVRTNGCESWRVRVENGSSD